MKIMTIFGTRPEIIKLSLVLRVLDQHCEHVMVNTGQDADDELSGIFIRDLEIRPPDINLAVTSSNGDQLGQMTAKISEILDQHKPDRVFVLGGSDSSLSAIAAAKRNIPVYHIEAGNRGHESEPSGRSINRLVDHASTVLMPCTNRAKENLLREGINPSRIFTVGNPLKEVLEIFADRIENSEVMAALAVKPFEYLLATTHRNENIENRERLTAIFDGLAAVATKFNKPVLVAAHPRTAEKLEEFGIRPASPSIRMLKAMNFFDFVKLEKNSLAVLTDSGTLQEECCILGVPNITLRNTTDRPETIECGSNILGGTASDSIIRAVELAIAQPASWTPPAEYLIPNVSQTVSRILLSYNNY